MAASDGGSAVGDVSVVPSVVAPPAEEATDAPAAAAPEAAAPEAAAPEAAAPTPMESSTMQVESSELGNMLGRGGARVKAIRQESGARVRYPSFHSPPASPRPANRVDSSQCGFLAASKDPGS